MASFVDETLQLDATHDSGFAVPARAGGPSRASSPAHPAAKFTEAVSHRREQWVELVPSGLALNISVRNPRSVFSFGKAGIVGALVSFGGSLVDRAAPSPNLSVAVGDTQSNELVVTVGRAVGTAPLSLSIPTAPALPKIAQNFGRTHNVLAGNVFGNSPTSVTCRETAEPAFRAQLFCSRADKRGTASSARDVGVPRAAERVHAQARRRH